MKNFCIALRTTIIVFLCAFFVGGACLKEGESKLPPKPSSDTSDQVTWKMFNSKRFPGVHFTYPKNYIVSDGKDSQQWIFLEKKDPAAIARIEIFRMEDFDEPRFAFAETESQKDTDEHVPKQRLREDGFDIWIFYEKDDVKVRDELYEIVKTIVIDAQVSSTGSVSASSTVEISGLTFALPKHWIVQTKVWGTARIKVPDPSYDVIIPVHVDKIDRVNPALRLVQTSASGAKLYMDACAPSIACYQMAYRGNSYEVVFAQPQSNEPAPEDGDGPWFPSTTVTEKDALNFFASVK